MIASLQPYFPNARVPLALKEIVELHADRFPGVRFAYLPIQVYREFCQDRGGIDATDRDAVRAVIADSTHVLFDLSHEGPGFIPQFAHTLARFANMYGIGPRRMIFATTNEAFAGALRAFPHAPNVAANVQVVWAHHHLYHLLKAALRRRHAETGHRLVDAPADRTVPYLSLNATPRGHRALLAYLVATHPQRDRFLLSFDLGGQKKDENELAQVVAPLAARFGLTLDAMRPVLADPDRFDRTRLSEATPHALVSDLEPELYARTRVSLVTETEMTPGIVLRTTEKVFKPLLLGQPLMVFGNPGTLALLRGLGVDTFDDVLDNGYDAIAEPAERFAAVWALANAHLADDAAFAVDPALRDRLHANVALFEGALMERVVARTLAELEAAVGAARVPGRCKPGSPLTE